VQQSGDHWHRRGVGMVGDRGTINSRVKGGRKYVRFWNEKFVIIGEVPLPVNLREEDKGSPEEELEKFCRDISFKEVSELSQHKKLQDLESHGCKVV